MIWENDIINILDFCLKIKTCKKMHKDDIGDHNYYA